MTSDESHIKFMTIPGAHLAVRLGSDAEGHPELLLLGNRAGLLSFAFVSRVIDEGTVAAFAQSVGGEFDARGSDV